MVGGAVIVDPPVRTSLPPYEQLLIAEGSGAVGIVISPLSLSLSCPVLVVLVLVLLISFIIVSSPPFPPPSCLSLSWRW